MQTVACSYSTLFGATLVATVPNSGSIILNGGSSFHSSSITVHPTLLSACSYQSSTKQIGVATGNRLSISLFYAKVARVARFSRAHDTRAREEQRPPLPNCSSEAVERLFEKKSVTNEIRKRQKKLLRDIYRF